MEYGVEQNVCDKCLHVKGGLKMKYGQVICPDCMGEDDRPIHYSRIESDLDSIEVSSSARRKMKIYFNSKSDSKEEVDKRIREMAEYCIKAEFYLKDQEVPI